MYFVVVNNQFLNKASCVIGPFNSKQEAQDWASEKDQRLTSTEFFDVFSVTSPDLIFQSR